MQCPKPSIRGGSFCGLPPKRVREPWDQRAKALSLVRDAEALQFARSTGAGGILET